MIGHGLVGEGAAHNDDGTRRKWNTTGGPGRAMCACGWLSEPAESGAERKRLHRSHKEFIRAEQELAGYPRRYVMSYGATALVVMRMRTGQSAPLNPDAEPQFIIDRGE